VAEIAIRAEGLAKAYRINHEANSRYRTLRGAITSLAVNAVRRTGRDSEEIWALRDVTFEVKRGETLGIIGRNGAGKSTLLKILSRITHPTTGSADLHGRLASLLEVGTGFHPELTGRENVYLNGAILGMRRTEIGRQFDEIVAFAGVERFLDTPVKRYSSGMYMRLAFAIAAHLQSEILVVDEVLAVGDAAFQEKCLSKMSDLSREGRTVLFVSHNLPAVESLCTSGLLLEQGVVAARGTSRTVIDQYLASVSDLTQTSLADRRDRQGNGALRLRSIEAPIRTGAPSSLRLRYTAKAPIPNATVLVGIYTTRGESAAWLSTEVSGNSLGELPTEGTIVCSFGRSTLMPGRYMVNVHVTVAGEVADYIPDAGVIDVVEGDFFGTGKLPPADHGSVLLDQQWSVETS
jgi:lipopolysaccharide transport system ATP-binding protein